ncbi:hypothetical protein BDFB_012065, partial [Asbolus verrucosus]
SVASLLIVSAGGVLENSVFPPLPVAVLNTDNAICKEQSDLYIQNLENFTLWAHENLNSTIVIVWDATAKSSTGILRGNVFQMGHFEQCLTAEAPFLTQYCLTRFKANVPKPKQPRDPISLYHHPNEHLLERLYMFLNKLETLYKWVGAFQHHVLHKIWRIFLILITLTVILVVLVILTTIYDFNVVEMKDEKPHKKSFLYRSFMSFSARKNFNDLTKMDESNGAMAVLYGVRTICILCIILDHRFGTVTSSALLNFNYVEEQYRAPLAPFLFHGDLFVDSFFLLGGLLVTYGLLNQFDKKRMNPGFIILMRYI